MLQCLSAVCNRTVAILILLPALLGGCGSKDTSPPAAVTEVPVGGDEAVLAGSDVAVDLSPETLEALVAPIALYPDVVRGHVLTASTNPQEVLDAGNWLLAHDDLPAGALNTEAEKLDVSTSMRALLQFPETVDMMCMQIGRCRDRVRLGGPRWPTGRHLRAEGPERRGQPQRSLLES